LKKSSRPWKGFVLVIAGNILVLGLLLALIEGLASYALLLRDLRDVPKTASLARQHYAKYDPDLGWVNKPDLDLPDVYGPGGYVKTNAQGFRSDHTIQSSVAPGQVRIFCSGDSYTFGYGVANSDTWCEKLARFEPHFEAVNIGGDGYGVDQAYLRYKRQALALEHQIHFFAFITDDFYRMLADSFLGYAKPFLKIENDRLVVRNVPVPARGGYAPRLGHLIEQMKSLRTFEFIRRLRHKIVQQGANDVTEAGLSQKQRDDKAQELLRQIFADLKKAAAEREIRLVLVYLPTIWELENRPLPGWSGHPQWSEFLNGEARRQDIPFIDVFERLAKVPHDTMVQMFIPEGKLPYPEARFHLNERGNEAVAEIIYDRVVSDAALVCGLAARGRPISAPKRSVESPAAVPQCGQ